MSRRATAGTLVLGLVLVVGATAFHERSSSPAAGPRGSSATRALTGAAGALPHPERPAFTVGRPRRLARAETTTRFASVARPAAALGTPATGAARVARLERRTPEGTTNIVLVLGEARLGSWVHVRLPVLPNDRTGWVPRRALGGYVFVHTRLVVDRERFRAKLFRDGRAVFAAPVGVGKPGSPTPSGEFYIRNRLHGFGNPFYGPIAFGTSARSAVLTDWPGGGFVGIHGTNAPQLIPGRISHGCIRLRNADILKLSRLMPVGTPLTIK